VGGATAGEGAEPRGLDSHMGAGRGWWSVSHGEIISGVFPTYTNTKGTLFRRCLTFDKKGEGVGGGCFSLPII